MSTWADTDAGIACSAIMTDAVSALVPAHLAAIATGYGPDDWARLDAAPIIKMMWRDEAVIKPGLRTGYPYDAMTPIACEVWGADPLVAQTMWHQVMISIDKIAHGRANEPGRWRVAGGEIGISGAKYIGTFGLRLGIFYAQKPRIKPTSAGVVRAKVSTEGIDLGP